MEQVHLTNGAVTEGKEQFRTPFTHAKKKFSVSIATSGQVF